ncbi:MAG: S9 family peptidase [Bacteroidia bacterium]|nr:S9 family peptidase [Bacteroidia bacterium]MCZ2276586.1 S9 family peptidase [Bacteroidia bacterium]
MKKILAILLTLTLLKTFTATSQTVYTPELLWKLKRISDHSLSPDGSKVVYTVRSFDLAANKGNTDIRLLDIKTGKTTSLANEHAVDETSPRWLSDYLIVYMAADSDGNNQLWMIQADGTGKKQISFFEPAFSISNYGFCRSAQQFWFTSEVKMLNVFGKEFFKDLPENSARIYDDLMYRHWNAWDDGSRTHVFTARFDGTRLGAATDIMKDEPFDSPLKPNGGAGQIDISADGKWIAYTCKKLNGKAYAVSTNSDIFLYEIASGKTVNLTEGMQGYDVAPRFSPDGSQLLWLSMETPGYEADRNRIMIIDLKTKQKREVTQHFDYSVDDARWSSDGLQIYFGCMIQATGQIWVYDSRLRSAYPFRQITHDTGDHTGFSIAGSGNSTVMVSSMMSMSYPAELFRINLKSGRSQQITFENQEILQRVATGKVEKRMVKTTDQKDMLVWVIYPPGFDPARKYPALLYCQGGPQSTVSQFFSYRWNFQLMAANGYIVVAPNRRGLPSFGTEWNREISGDWGGQCMKDYLSAIDDVSKESYVDKDKMGAVGASFGGYSVYWLAGHHQKRFKAFIAHCGVFNLESMYGTTEELWFTNFDLGGPYWQTPQPKSYREFSPHDFVNDWDTPILIIHNQNDFRVPLGQGMDAFTAARLKNIPARFLYFPDEYHWVTRPQNSVVWQRVFFSWLDRYLK